jgi:hypothetical protein
MAESAEIGGHKDGFLATMRSDNWRRGPILTVLGLGLFGIYSTIMAFANANYTWGPYLSPFYSPVLFYDPQVADATVKSHAWFGTWPSAIPWPGFLPKSPAFLILLFPGSFRVTCYYYRKAYYRSFFGSPPGCAVGPRPEGQYNGETKLFLFQNLHRYALYFAIVFIGILYYDAWLACWYNGQFGVGVGTIVMFINATLLAGYTFGCHSFRHLIGGKLNNFTCDSPCELRHVLWKKVTVLNTKHMNFAWFSLFWVGFTDFYIRMVAMGHIKDLNTWGI